MTRIGDRVSAPIQPLISRLKRGVFLCVWVVVSACGPGDDARPDAVIDGATDGGCVVAAECPAPQAACTVAVCTAAGACATTAAAMDSACDDGEPCTAGDRCVASGCLGATLVCDCLVDSDCETAGADHCVGTQYCDRTGVKPTCRVNAASGITCPKAKGPCAVNLCDPADGICKYVPVPAAVSCDDGDPCTLKDVCEAGKCGGTPDLACECATSADCAAHEDGDLCTGTLFCDAANFPPRCKLNPVTVVSCGTALNVGCQVHTCSPSDGLCHPAALPDGATCDVDGFVCTADACKNGSCQQAQPGGSCTCNQDADCQKYGNNNACDGTLYCNQSLKTCMLNPATVVTCPTVDDTGCSKTQCNPKTGGCEKVATPAFYPCDDGYVCSSGDACDGKGACQPGTNTCQCTSSAECAKYAPTDQCAAKLYCVKPEGVCKPNPATLPTCDQGGDVACAKNLCDPKTGDCKMTPVHTGQACEADNSACTTIDTCQDGACATAANTCPCFKDADCADKDDGDLCNGTLYCDLAAKTCKPNPASLVQCAPSGAVCLPNLCDAKTGKCGKTPALNGTKCETDDFFCTQERCQAGSCQVSKPENTCLCWEDGDCEAIALGNLCIGTLYCDKTASAGKQPVCKLNKAATVVCPLGDGKSCDVSVCAPKTGKCTGVKKVVDGSPCDDGDVCTQSSACTQGVCVGKPDKLGFCDDKLPCTVDSCSPLSGCVHTAANAGACSDGDVCTTDDVCTAGACKGAPLVCADKGGCASSACDAETGCQYAVVAEICNGKDDDCDGVVDNGCDDDKDGFCDAKKAVTAGALCSGSFSWTGGCLPAHPAMFLPSAATRVVTLKHPPGFYSYVGYHRFSAEYLVGLMETGATTTRVLRYDKFGTALGERRLPLPTVLGLDGDANDAALFAATASAGAVRVDPAGKLVWSYVGAGTYVTSVSSDGTDVWLTDAKQTPVVRKLSRKTGAKLADVTLGYSSSQGQVVFTNHRTVAVASGRIWHVAGTTHLARFDAKGGFDLALKIFGTGANQPLNGLFTGREICLTGAPDNKAVSRTLHCYLVMPPACSAVGDDCDDDDTTVNPAVAEVCDGVDDDGDGKADQDCDRDGDGHCGAHKVVLKGATCTAGDCVDVDANAFPGAKEVCDGLDSNCDTKIDDGCDEDGDGFCAKNSAVLTGALSTKSLGAESGCALQTCASATPDFHCGVTQYRAPTLNLDVIRGGHHPFRHELWLSQSAGASVVRYGAHLAEATGTNVAALVETGRFSTKAISGLVALAGHPQRDRWVACHNRIDGAGLTLYGGAGVDNKVAALLSSGSCSAVAIDPGSSTVFASVAGKATALERWDLKSGQQQTDLALKMSSAPAAWQGGKAFALGVAGGRLIVNTKTSVALLFDLKGAYVAGLKTQPDVAVGFVWGPKTCRYSTVAASGTPRFICYRLLTPDCGAGGDDCDDKDASVHPGPELVCDGEDSSCDGAADEGCDWDDDKFCAAGHEVRMGALCTKSLVGCKVTHGGTCYFPTTSKNIAFFASGLCSLVGGATLAVILDEAENAAAAAALKTAEIAGAAVDGFLGLHDTKQDGIYVWGPIAKDATWVNFAAGGKKAGQSGQVTMSSADGKWTEQTSTSTAFGVCERPIPVDCDDADASINPGLLTDICDGLDNNCDGKTDEKCDDDNDGYCDSGLPVLAGATCSNSFGPTGKCSGFTAVTNAQDTVFSRRVVVSGVGAKKNGEDVGQSWPHAFRKEWWSQVGGQWSRHKDDGGLLGGFNGSHLGNAWVASSDEDAVYVYVSDKLQRFDGLSQKTTWVLPTNGAIEGLLGYDKARLWVKVAGANKIVCADAKTGEGCEFEVSVALQGGHDLTKIAVQSGKLYVPAGSKQLFRYDLLSGKPEFAVTTGTESAAGLQATASEVCVAETTFGLRPRCYTVTQPACAAGGDDCNDHAGGTNPATVETCDGVDDNCDGVKDDGCDADLDGFCDEGHVVKTAAACPKSFGPLGTCHIATAVKPGVMREQAMASTSTSALTIWHAGRGRWWVLDQGKWREHEADGSNPTEFDGTHLNVDAWAAAHDADAVFVGLGTGKGLRRHATQSATVTWLNSHAGVQGAPSFARGASGISRVWMKVKDKDELVDFSPTDGKKGNTTFKISLTVGHAMDEFFAVQGDTIWVAGAAKQAARYDLATGKPDGVLLTNPTYGISRLSAGLSELCVNNDGAGQLGRCFTIASLSCPNNKGDDCDDSDATQHPGGEEQLCDGKDNNCNKVADEGCDDDKDGFCQTGKTVLTGATCTKTLSGVGRNCDGEEGIAASATAAPVTIGSPVKAGQNLQLSGAAYVGWHGYFREWWVVKKATGIKPAVIVRVSSAGVTVGSVALLGIDVGVALVGNPEQDDWFVNLGDRVERRLGFKHERAWRSETMPGAGALTFDINRVLHVHKQGTGTFYRLDLPTGALLEPLTIAQPSDTGVGITGVASGGDLLVGWAPKTNPGTSLVWRRYPLKDGKPGAADAFTLTWGGILPGIANVARGVLCVPKAAGKGVECRRVATMRCHSGDDCDDDDKDVFPGAPDVCNNKDDDCDNQTDNCSDGDICTGEETCKAGTCTGVPSCSDGVVCTADSCSLVVQGALQGGCSWAPQSNNAVCDDGNPCTAGDKCSKGSCDGAGVGAKACGATGTCTTTVTPICGCGAGAYFGEQNQTCNSCACGPGAKIDHVAIGTARVTLDAGADRAVSALWVMERMILAGIPSHSATQNGAGAVRAFHSDAGGAWTSPSPLILPPTAHAGGAFGRAMTMARDRLLISEPGNGQARVHAYVVGGVAGWTYETMLTTPSNLYQTADFGSSLAFCDDRLFIGASTAEVGGVKGHGAIYQMVYSQGSNTWAGAKEVVVSHGLPAQSNLGASRGLACQGGRLYAGAPGADGKGAVWLMHLDWQTGSYAITTKISPPASGYGASRFGNLAVLGQRMLVGAPGYASETGVGLSYTISTDGKVTQSGVLTRAGHKAGEAVGADIALAGDLALLGVPWRQVGGKSNAGAAELWRWDGAKWLYVLDLVSKSAVALSAYGNVLGFYGGDPVVAAGGGSPAIPLELWPSKTSCDAAGRCDCRIGFSGAQCWQATVY